MEEDPSNDDNRPKADQCQEHNEEMHNGTDVKRLKTSDSGRSEESSSTSSNNTEKEIATTSDGQTTDSGFNSLRKSIPKNRHYRNSRETNNDDNANDNGIEQDDVAMEDVDENRQRTEGEISTFGESDNEWEDYEEEDSDDDDDNDNEGSGNDEDDDDDAAELPSDQSISGFSQNFSSDDLNSLINDTDNDYDDEGDYEEDDYGGIDDDDDNDDDDNEINDHPLFKKDKPKNSWFAVNEIINRQYGSSAKLQSRELFQRNCYGSLSSVKRLELMYKLEEHQGCVNSLNFHPDGTLLASGADDLRVVIWDWKLGKCLMKYKTKHKANVFQSKFLHLTGDLHIASCARDGQVRLAEISREGGIRSTRLLGTHRRPCHKLIVLPEQPHIILSAGEDGVVLNHDVRGPKSNRIVTVVEDGKEVALYSIHGHPLKTNEFIVSGRDSLVRVYDQRKSNKPTSIYSAFKKTRNRSFKSCHVTCAIYNYNGTEILASYSDSDIFLFDVNDRQLGHYLHRYQGHRNQATIKGVNFFGPKSEFIVSGSDCGRIYFWERNTEALVQWLLADDNGVVNCLEPHPQLPFICTSGLDWDIKVWVPSSTLEPNMDGLSKTLKRNNRKKTHSESTEINESQMLWMLWRHLRNTSQLRTNAVVFPRNPQFLDSNSSGSDSMSSPDSDEDFGGPPNCTTS